jgi:hypothetical protein
LFLALAWWSQTSDAFRAARTFSRVIASAAKQSSSEALHWIASSQALLAMTSTLADRSAHGVVIAGLDPAIHAALRLAEGRRIFACFASAWTTGSSPVVTIKG